MWYSVERREWENRFLNMRTQMKWCSEELVCKSLKKQNSNSAHQSEVEFLEISAEHTPVKTTTPTSTDERGRCTQTREVHFLGLK